MQLHLTMKGTDITLPIAYRSILQGMIYHSLTSDRAYSDFLHDQGRLDEKRRYKGFTFSPLKGTYRIKGKYICFPGTASFEIRSADDRLIALLAEALSVGKSVSLGKNSAELIQSRATDYRLLVPAAGIKMISPMVAYYTEADGTTRYLSPHDPEYLHAIKLNARRKWNSFSNPGEFLLDIEPIKEFPVSKEVTSFKQTYITAWYGAYRMSGTPEVMDFLYQTGLGAKSSQGFGMFDLL